MSSHYSPIPIINRMSSLLNSILASPNGLRANELLRTENIPKTTLYRLLTSMTENELLTYIPTSGVYTLGPKFTAAYTSMDERAGRLREAAMPHLRFLAEQVQETVKLTVLSGMQSYSIASVEGTRPIRISIDSGALFPLHAGASGKILMCCLNDAAIQRYYSQYGIRYTETTIMTVEDMKEELNRIRRSGYAVDNGEYMPEIRATAAPVQDAAGQIIAAVSVAYPVSNQDHIDPNQLALQIMQTARTVGAAYTSKETWDRPARLVHEHVGV